MKKITTFLLLMYLSLVTFSQTPLFTESCGTPSATTAVGTYTGWQNYPTLTFTGNADVRTTTVSSGYTGASGSGNVFITNTVGTNVTISNINTLNYINLKLSAGVFKSTTASNGSELKIEVSTDGITYTALTYTLPTGTGTAIWRLVTPTGTIPSTSNLRIRFRNTSSTPQFRIDDIKLVGDYVAPLPVELMSFTGKVTEDKIQLQWSTASESNNESFTVEKLINEKWEPTIVASGAGWSNYKTDYTVFDHAPLPGNNYYRLKQVDFDGTTSYSYIILVRYEGIIVNDEVEYYDLNGRRVTELQPNTPYIKIVGGKAKQFFYVQ